MRLAMAFLLLASSLLACGGEERPADPGVAAPRAEAAAPPGGPGVAPEGDDVEFLGDEGNEADQGDEY